MADRPEQINAFEAAAGGAVSRPHLTSPHILMEHQGELLWVTPDIACVQILIANCYLVRNLEKAGSWVLVDAGVGARAATRIKSAAETCCGTGTRPECIVLTHAHFDHVGGVVELARDWDVVVYAHAMEMPYLTGRSDYPPPDPTVGGGLMARVSGFYPRHPVYLGERVRTLPPDGTVPGLPEWRWLHTPGHTPGHISLFRHSDGAMIVGDAFITTNQQSALSVLTQYQHVYGPPTYFTQDWNAARSSVRQLAALRPSLAATGHGIPMYGEHLDHQLQELAADFDHLAIPRHGRYVSEPAVFDQDGVAYVPAKPLNYVPALVGAALLGAGLIAGRRIAQQYRQGIHSHDRERTAEGAVRSRRPQ
jgi:glyoxylase-like metal-dependent hydrolase (beta-lactamase superfamily II)